MPERKPIFYDQERRRWRRGRGGVWTTSCLSYFSIVCVRSPAAFLDESLSSGVSEDCDGLPDILTYSQGI